MSFKIRIDEPTQALNDQIKEIPDATPTAAGVMSAADKAKLDQFSAGGSYTTVPVNQLTFTAALTSLVLYLVATDKGAVTFTLPAGAAPGTLIGVIDNTQTALNNPITVNAPAGGNINALSSVQLAKNGIAAQFFSIGANGWRILTVTP